MKPMQTRRESELTLSANCGPSTFLSTSTYSNSFNPQNKNIRQIQLVHNHSPNILRLDFTILYIIVSAGKKKKKVNIQTKRKTKIT